MMRSDRASDGSSRMATASTWESMAEASTSRAATRRIDVSWKPASMTSLKKPCVSPISTRW